MTHTIRKMILLLKEKIILYCSVQAPFLFIKKRFSYHTFCAVAQKVYNQSVHKALRHKAVGIALYWDDYYHHLHFTLLREYRRAHVITKLQYLLFTVFPVLMNIFQTCIYVLSFHHKQYSLGADNRSFPQSDNFSHSIMTYSGKNKALLPESIQNRLPVFSITYTPSDTDIVISRYTASLKTKIQVLILKIRYPLIPCILLEKVLIYHTLIYSFIRKSGIKKAYFEEGMNTNQLICFSAAHRAGLQTVFSYRSPLPYIPLYFFGHQIIVCDSLTRKYLRTCNRNVKNCSANYSINWKAIIAIKEQHESQNRIIGYGPDLGNYIINWKTKTQYDNLVLTQLKKEKAAVIVKCHPMVTQRSMQYHYYQHLKKRYPHIVELKYKEDIATVFTRITIWITTMSTTVIQSVLCKIPVILLNFHQDNIYSELVAASEGLIGYAQKAEDIKFLLDKYTLLLQNPAEFQYRWEKFLKNVGIDKIQQKEATEKIACAFT